MSEILELTINLKPKAMEGGYTYYTSSDLPGFQILCEPNEDPIPLIESVAQQFIPAAASAMMRRKVALSRLRILPVLETLSKGVPATIRINAELAPAA